MGKIKSCEKSKRFWEHPKESPYLGIGKDQKSFRAVILDVSEPRTLEGASVKNRILGFPIYIRSPERELTVSD